MFYQFGASMFSLMCLHAIGDWLFQPHSMAIRKTKEWTVRLLHVNIYTVTMYFGCALLGVELTWQEICWIFFTHYVIDSYKPLFRFRQIMGDPNAKTIETFKSAFNTPNGFYVYVTLDQIFHLITLMPVAISVANRHGAV